VIFLKTYDEKDDEALKHLPEVGRDIEEGL